MWIACEQSRVLYVTDQSITIKVKSHTRHLISTTCLRAVSVLDEIIHVPSIPSILLAMMFFTSNNDLSSGCQAYKFGYEDRPIGSSEHSEQW